MAKTQKMQNLYPQPHYEEEDEFDEEDELDEDEEEEEEEVEESENAEKLNEEIPEQKAETKSITVKLKNSEINRNDDLMMKIDEDIQLRWLMIHYCKKKGVQQSVIKFVYNGVVVRDTDTPLQLSMVDRDVIYIFPKYPKQDLYAYNAIRYKTLCLRMHKRRDTFVRLISTDPVLPQLKRHLSYGKSGKCVSTCFVFNGRQLSESELLTACQLGMQDGDIIDVFDFAESSSSLSIITPANAPVRHLTLKVRGRWGGPFDIRVKGNTPLKEVAHKYSGKTNVDLFYIGRRLSLKKTVEEERLFDGCALVVHQKYV